MSSNADILELIGGELCLAFADTVDWRKSDHPQELVAEYSDLLSWSQDVDILPAEDAQHLLREAEQRQAEADTALECAIALRDTIYRIFAAIANEESPDPQDLDLFNDALSETLIRMQIVPTSEGFGWDWTSGGESLKRMLWPVVRSAADLLTSQRLDRVKQCPGCGWLFLDTSRNRSRRWCTMRVCGNRAKARRHYERKRSQRAKSETYVGPK